MLVAATVAAASVPVAASPGRNRIRKTGRSRTMAAQERRRAISGLSSDRGGETAVVLGPLELGLIREEDGLELTIDGQSNRDRSESFVRHGVFLQSAADREESSVSGKIGRKDLPVLRHVPEYITDAACATPPAGARAFDSAQTVSALASKPNVRLRPELDRPILDAA